MRLSPARTIGGGTAPNCSRGTVAVATQERASETEREVPSPILAETPWSLLGGGEGGATLPLYCASYPETAGVHRNVALWRDRDAFCT